MKRKAFFIAEVSSNHNQDLQRAISFIKVAKKIGCDAIKFQLFQLQKLFSKEAIQSNKNLLKRSKWELPTQFLPEIHRACKGEGIQFYCTPFDLESVKKLSDFVDGFKISSYELLWTQLYTACLDFNLPTIGSVGMATLEEIENLNQKLNRYSNISFLHCVSEYPTPINNCNLNTIDTIRNLTNRPVGWSDHSRSPSVVIGAVLRHAASTVEFHLDLDCRGAEYSGGHCWLPSEISEVIQICNESLEATGNSQKPILKSESEERVWRADPVDGLRPLKTFRNKLK